MLRIQQLLANDNPDPVADQIEAMTRLRDPAVSAGLIARRRRETSLWRNGFQALQVA